MPNIYVDIQRNQPDRKSGELKDIANVYIGSDKQSTIIIDVSENLPEGHPSIEDMAYYDAYWIAEENNFDKRHVFLKKGDLDRVRVPEPRLREAHEKVNRFMDEFDKPSMEGNPKTLFFDRDKAGNEDYDAMLHDDYRLKGKVKNWSIVDLSPPEFFKLSAKALNEPLVRQWHNINYSLVEQYAHHMTTGMKFPMPVIDFNAKKAIGKHTVFAAKSLNESSVPVMVIFPVGETIVSLRKSIQENPKLDEVLEPLEHA